MYLKLLEFEVALNITRGKGMIVSWFRKDTPEEDKMFKDAADVVTSALSNADEVRRIEAITGKNLRDQLSVEEAQAIAEEGKLRGFGFRRN